MQNLHTVNNIVSESQKCPYCTESFFEIEKWLSYKQAAHYLSITVGSLRAKVSRGEVQWSGLLGRSPRFRREELDQLLVSSLTKEKQ